MQAIILAGGKGTRLRPFTTTIPKPLMPIGDLPILEVVLRQLKYFGVNQVVLAVSHLAELIMAFFRNGSKFGLNIRYSIEDEPLGTAGPLALIQDLEENFIVMNGDILSTINFKDLFDFHINRENDVTIASYKKEVKIDLGVLKFENEEFLDYIEKPTYYFDVSMGIYVINKKVINYIPNNAYMDIPNLILRLRDEGMKIRCYSGDYFWLDIGRVEDYQTAVKIFNDRRNEFLL